MGVLIDTVSSINKREVNRRGEPPFDGERDHGNKLATIFNCARSMGQVDDGSSNQQGEQN